MATAYQTISAAAIAMPVSQSDPITPNVELATTPSRRPVRYPHIAAG